MEKILPIIGILKNRRSVLIFVAVSSAFFSINYYALKKLPSSNGFMCTIGGNISVLNIVFITTISIAIGLLVVGLIQLTHKKKYENRFRIGSASAAGTFTGMLTTFCTFCTLPILGLFGVGAVLSFIAEYQIYIKSISILILGISVYLLNKQLRGKCKICVS